MKPYRYVKATPKKQSSIHVQRIMSVIFICSGVFLLMWTLWPIVSFILYTAPDLSVIVSPVPTVYAQEPSKIVGFAENGFLFASKTLTGTDYTNPNVWYPNKPQQESSGKVNTYSLSIPKLGIDNAVVVIYGSDLNKSLIHYGGTGLPGDYGNAVIFGHSTLPHFFNPKDYKAIFSTLPTLKIGDDIFITYDGVTYTYAVYDMTVTMPTDVSSLEQRYDDSYITIVTCVPPGTYAKRLNVKGRLKKV
jgi:sortase A